MINIAKRFVAEWIDEYVKKTPPLKDDPATVEDLVLRLENDAWDFGLSRMDFLEAVEGDSFEFVFHEIYKVLERNSRTCEGSNCEHLPPA